MKKKIGIIAPFVLLTISFLVSVLFISKNYYVLMNGDTAAEMLYGRLLADESGAMSHNWFYSTELRTLGVQYFYKLGFMIFGNNYYAVRLFADIIMLVVLAASYIFMMSSMGLKKIGIWTAWVIILPFSPVYAYFIIYAEFYSMYSTFCYLLLGNIFLVFRSKDEKIKVALEICLLAVISFVSGLCGVRMAMICLGPALCATLINLYLWFRKNDSFEILEKMKNDLKLFKVVCFSFFFYFLGYLFSAAVLTKKYGYSGQHFYWSGFSIENVIGSLTLFIKAFGHWDGASFFKLHGLASIFAVFIFLVMTTSVVKISISFWNLGAELKFYLIYAGVLFASNLFLISCTSIGAPIGYWVPVVMMVIPFAFMINVTEKNVVAKRCGYLFTTIIFFAFALVTLATFRKPIDTEILYCMDRTELRTVVEVIENQGYSKGFAPFWDSNPITEISNGRVEMWTISEKYDGKVNSTDYIEPWLQKKSHKTGLPEGKFVVVTYSEKFDGHDYVKPGKLDALIARQDNNMIYEGEKYKVYGFADLDEYQMLLDTIQEEK